MTLHRSNPGLWLFFGKSVRPVVRQRFQRDGRSGPGALRPLAAGPRSRLALAAALVVATFLLGLVAMLAIYLIFKNKREICQSK